MPGSPAKSSAYPAKEAKPRGELALIEQIRLRAARQTSSRGALVRGIGDDCAILRPRRGEDIVVTTDFSLEGRHFRRDWHSAASAGHRTLARGLSDLAAMGSRPLAAFLSLAIPRALMADQAWVDEYLDGLLSLARRAGIPLAGGDTAEAPGTALLADIVCLGTVPAGRALRRDTAKAGDRLFVTGSLGGAAAELASLSLRSGKQEMLKKAPSAGALHPQLFPEPRLACGQALVRRGLATAAMDISDGLSTDLLHLCQASRLSAEVDEWKLPLHPLLATSATPAALSQALHGGEDYELLFTAAPETRVPRSLGGVRLTEIGRLLPTRTRRPRMVLLDRAGQRRPLPAGGWEHLR